MSDLKMTSDRIGSEVTLRLIGEINEKASIALPDLVEVKILVFDFMHIKHINSSGIRFWIQFVQALPKGIVPHFKNVPKIVVDQMSMVVGFMPSGSIVESFEMPYYCDKCGKSESEMLQKDLHFDQATATSPAGVRLPKKNCGKPDCDLSPDMLPKKYLRFLEIPKG